MFGVGKYKPGWELGDLVKVNKEVHGSSTQVELKGKNIILLIQKEKN